MTTDNHTPITTGAAANAATFNAPLGQLDAAMGEVDDLTTTIKTDLVSAVNEIDADVGNPAELTTSSKTNLVAAANEIDAVADAAASEIQAARAGFLDLDARLDDLGKVAVASSGVGTTTLSSQANQGATSLSVQSAAGFVDGDYITVLLDSGALHASTVDGTPVGNTIVIDDALPSVAGAGKIVSKSLVEIALARGGYSYLGQRLDNFQSRILQIEDDPTDDFLRRFPVTRINRKVSIQYVDASNRYIWTPMDGFLTWARWTMTLNVNSIWTLEDMRIYRHYNTTPDTDAGITYSAGWSHTAGSGELDATRSFTDNTAGRTAEWTVTGAERIYVSITTRSNGGYAIVTIDGANDLVIGPQIVELGSDKVINTYTAALVYNNWYEIASGLNPAATYTVRLALHADIPPGAENKTLFLEGYGIPPLFVGPTQTGNTVKGSYELLDAVSTDSGYAIAYKPVGASGYELTGSDHFDEVSISAAFNDYSGQDASVDATHIYKIVDGLRIIQELYARHSETGTQNNAEVHVEFVFDSSGLTQSVRHKWLVGGDCSHAYTGMLPLGTVFNRGHVAGDGDSIYDLTVNDDARHGQLPTRLAVLWGTTHDYVIAAWVESLAGLMGYRYSDYMTYIQDYVSGTIEKIYFRYIGNTGGMTGLAITTGDVWKSVFHYGAFVMSDFVP